VRDARIAAMLVVTAAGCVSPPAPTDNDRLRGAMGRNDDHRLRIQYQTHAPGRGINERVAAIEKEIASLAGLRPFGDTRDALLTGLVPRALIRLSELRDAEWTKENVAENWRKLEATCAGCHQAFERR